MRNKVTYRSWVFKDPKISVSTVGLEQSLPINTLGIDTFDVEVKCNDKSILQFNQNEPINWYHRRRQMGIYYVQSVKRISADHYTIASISTLGLLEQRDFLGGIYTGQTVENVVAAICGNIPFTIKSNLRKIKLYGWLGITSARLALQQVLFAIGANLSTDSNGVLHIANLWDGISSVISSDRVYIDNNNVQQDNPVTSVTVLEHQYIPQTAERKDLYNGTTTQGQRIPFNEPHSSLQADGFEILESGANYAVVSAGNGKLTGCPYIHTTIEVTKPVTSAPIEHNERIEDATLVSLVNSNTVAERMADYYKCRTTIAEDVVLKYEHPGQVVQVYHPWDHEMVNMAIASAGINVDSVLKGSITGLMDFAPKQIQATVIYDHHELITESGTWTVPEGCTKVRAILIGGGSRGTRGGNGTAGGSGGRGHGGSAGISGRGGAGGSGGKILDITIAVEPGQVLDVSIGRGGDATDIAGGDTTFAGHSSAEGAAVAAGYTDPVSGIVYGKAGAAGLQAQAHGAGTASGNEIWARFVNMDLTGSAYSNVWQVGTGGRASGNGNYSGATVGNYKDKGSSGYDAYYYYDVTFTAYPGYNGTSPSARAAATVPGCGGDGGHGGGGGGGASGYSPSVSKGTKMYGLNIGGTNFHWIIRNVIEETAEGGKGGTGGQPGNGAPGILILHYGVETPLRSGILVDSNYNFLADKFGRLLIV